MGEPRRRGTEREEHTSGKVVAVLLVVALVLGGVAVAIYQRYSWCRGADDTRTPVTFVVPAGASGDAVVQSLADHHVIRCGGLFGKTLLHEDGSSDVIRAGTYKLTTGMTLEEALHVLTTAPKAVATVRFTVIPGQRAAQIAEEAHRAFGFPSQTFLNLALHGVMTLPGYLEKGRSTEGFLFPQTYSFVKGTGPADVIKRLLQEFQKETTQLPWSNAQGLGMSRYQIVTIASLVEKEATLSAQKPLVAAVIYNRLKAGMTLGLDSTVAYIDPTPNDGLQESEFKIHSPYNTRLVHGLPPTPIASPGLDSLRAALDPAHVPYLYFVSCGKSNRDRFATTYSGFLHLSQVCL